MVTWVDLILSELLNLLPACLVFRLPELPNLLPAVPGVSPLGVGDGVGTLDGFGVCSLDGVGVCSLDGVGVCILDKAGVWLTGLSMSLGVLGNCSMVIAVVSLSEVAGIVSLVVVNSFIRVYSFNMTGACPIV